MSVTLSDFMNATVVTTVDTMTAPLSEVFFPSLVVCNINQVALTDISLDWMFLLFRFAARSLPSWEYWRTRLCARKFIVTLYWVNLPRNRWEEGRGRGRELSC